MSHRKTILLGVLATLAVPASASAATATISPTAKTAHLTGTIITEPTGFYEFATYENGGTEVAGQNTCIAPNCEEHTLTVSPGGAEIKLDATSNAYSLDIELVDPSGANTIESDWLGEPNGELHRTIDATEGNWTVRVYGAPNDYTFDYDVGFTLRTPEDVASDPPPPADEG